MHPEPTPTPPPLPGIDSALFLDFDGTLAELAPQPDAVHVPATLPPLLARLDAALGGALAVVSGRPVAELDHQLQPYAGCAAGVHGVERRSASGALQRLPVQGLEAAAALAAELVRQYPALRLEVKPGAIALHYRQAPALQAECLATMQHALAATKGMALMHGKMVLELKPERANKGLAIAAFLAEAPFLQRRPWFFGDDVTDESGFETVQALGGVAVKVGDGPTQARHHLPDPAAVQRWLQQAAAQLAAPVPGARA